MKTIFIGLLFTLCYPDIIFSQFQEIVIDHIGGGADLNEPAIQINPYNTDHIVAGSNIASYYYSFDGGYTWSEGSLNSTYGVWGDPVIACDNEGDFYFFHLSNPDLGNWIDRIVCQKSTDGGYNWNNGSFMGLNGSKAQDKEWVTIDRSTNIIYTTWTEFDEYGSSLAGDSSRILFSKSTDAGASWTSAYKLNKVSGNCLDDDHTVEGAVPAVGPNGEVYVAWAGRGESGNLGIIFDKSIDYGNSWMDEDIFVCDFPGGWVFDIPGINRCNGLPVLKCDTSGGIYNGTLYINWTDQQNGEDDTDVWIVKSVDGGVTWSEKIRVNDDPAGKQQFFTWLDIDQTNGNLYVIFYDRRHYGDTKTDVYMAVSEDGGETFENIRISETAFTPSSSVFFGDYTNISVYNGKIAPIWARADGASMSLRTTVFEASLLENEQSTFPNEIYPNPSSSIFYYSYKIKREEDVCIYISDIFGKKIVNIEDVSKKRPGKYLETFDPTSYNLKSGVYFFNFRCGDKREVKKIIFKQ